MKKVLIITGGTLPVPSVSGGAVETLIDSLVKLNEEIAKMKIEIISCWHPLIDKTDTEKKYTSYHVIRYPFYLKLLDDISYFYMERIRHDWRSMFVRNRYRSRYYERRIASEVDLRGYDAVVVENNMSLLRMVKDKLREEFSEKCFYHMHSVLIDNQSMIPYLKECRKIMTVSDYVRKELQRTVPEFSGTEIVKVTNGICGNSDVKNNWRQVRDGLREKLHIKKTEKVYLYSGRLSPEKGVLECVRAFAGAKLPNAKLVVTGSVTSGKNEKNSYMKKLFEAGESAREDVIFTGYIPHEKMAEYYAMADVLIVPSVVGDAAPLTVLEGMYYGMYLIASNVGGIPEYTQWYSRKKLIEYDEKFPDRLKEAITSLAENPGSDMRKTAESLYSERIFYEEFVSEVFGQNNKK